MTSGIGLRSVVQAGVFLIVARVLGVESYGAFASVMAISCTIGIFGGFGVQVLMVRDVSRDPEKFARAWGQTLAAIVVSSPLLFGIYLLIAWIILPDKIDWTVFFFIGAADILFAPFAQATMNAFQGHERIGRAAWLTLAPVLPRLMGAVLVFPLLLFFDGISALTIWSILYALSAVVAAIYSVWIVISELGLPAKPDLTKLFAETREGVVFAFGGAALKLFADIDKTMLACIASLASAGSYSAAYRLIDMASIPIVGLLTAGLPRFFKLGETGINETLRYTRRLLPIPCVYAVIVGIFMFFASGLLPGLLGSDYFTSVPAMKWLALLPLISLPRLFLQTLLIAGDRQRSVVATLCFGSVFNIIFNFLLIPFMDWRGAVISTYASEILMGVVMFMTAKR
jgi:O-antigen/teichoic acid export membrane protein